MFRNQTTSLRISCFAKGGAGSPIAGDIGSSLGLGHVGFERIGQCGDEGGCEPEW